MIDVELVVDCYVETVHRKISEDGSLSNTFVDVSNCSCRLEFHEGSSSNQMVQFSTEFHAGQFGQSGRLNSTRMVSVNTYSFLYASYVTRITLTCSLLLCFKSPVHA